MNKQKTIITRKLLSVMVLSFCLMGLTGINFILYPGNSQISSNIISNGEILCEEEIPQVPAEEKSTENPITSHEDFLHERVAAAWLISATPLLHKLMNADKLPFIHFDLISPPPDC